MGNASTQLNLRVAPEDKELIQDRAAILKKSVTRYLLDLVRAEAEQGSLLPTEAEFFGHTGDVDSQEVVGTSSSPPRDVQPLQEVVKNVQQSLAPRRKPRPENYSAWPPARRQRWDEANGWA